MLEIIKHAMAKKGEKKTPWSLGRLSQELAIFVAGDYEGMPRPTVFDPRTRFEGDCQGIDPLQLGKYAKEGELEKLTVRPKL